MDNLILWLCYNVFMKRLLFATSLTIFVWLCSFASVFAINSQTTNTNCSGTLVTTTLSYSCTSTRPPLDVFGTDLPYADVQFLDTGEIGGGDFSFSPSGLTGPWTILSVAWIGDMNGIDDGGVNDGNGASNAYTIFCDTAEHYLKQPFLNYYIPAITSLTGQYWSHVNALQFCPAGGSLDFSVSSSNSFRAIFAYVPYIVSTSTIVSGSVQDAGNLTFIGYIILVFVFIGFIGYLWNSVTSKRKRY